MSPESFWFGDSAGFTGGGVAARKVLAAATQNLTPVATELGGKSANIVFADADVALAAQLAAYQGPILQSGQSCACASRILVEDPAYDAFVEHLIPSVQHAKIGDPFDPEVVVGPVISQAAADRILMVINDAVDQAAGTLVTGGKRLGETLASGYYIEPMVFSDVDNHSQLVQFETFGPVVSVMRFRGGHALSAPCHRLRHCRYRAVGRWLVGRPGGRGMGVQGGLHRATWRSERCGSSASAPLRSRLC